MPSVRAWGWGTHGQLCQGSAEDSHLPKVVAVPGGAKVCNIAAGYAHTLVLTEPVRCVKSVYLFILFIIFLLTHDFHVQAKPTTVVHVFINALIIMSLQNVCCMLRKKK